MKKVTVSLIVAAVVLAVACNKKADNNTTTPVTTAYLDLPDTTTQFFVFGSSVQSEQVNQQAQLGRVLFYDRHLSINNATACADCHKQEYAFSDNAQFSRGFENRLTGRNSMALQNLGMINLKRSSNGQFLPSFNSSVNLFWDGRETNLENLVVRPIANHVEMGISNLETLPAKLQKLPYYNDLFVKAYGDNTVTLERISESVAVFLTSITANNTRFDQSSISGGGTVELNARELHGRQLFNVKYNCASCHQLNPGPYNANIENFANIGLDEHTTDKGAGAIKGANMDGVFKAPSLRNVAVTAPYMHDGRYATLEDVIDHYSKKIQPHSNLDQRLRDNDGKPMKMNITEDEKQSLVAFLRTFTDYHMLTEPMYQNPFKTR